MIKLLKLNSSTPSEIAYGDEDRVILYNPTHFNFFLMKFCSSRYLILHNVDLRSLGYSGRGHKGYKSLQRLENEIGGKYE